MNPYYREYSQYLKELFGCKVQKLSVDMAFSCPNRDGRLGTGGCIYCNNDAFSPDLEKRGTPVAEQIERGKVFFGRKYPEMKYLAYFQSYTSTYGESGRLLDYYRSALTEDVVGILIGTRPDCIPDELIAGLTALERSHNTKIMIEFGVESMHDRTLERINRHHDSSCAIDAIERCSAAGFPIGVHLIAGLPGEDENDIFETVDRINALPVSSVKFHQLQVLKGTKLAQMHAAGELTDCLSFTPDSYARLCARIVKRLRSDIAIDRFVAQAPADMLISPKWGLKNYEFTALLHKCLESGEPY